MAKARLLLVDDSVVVRQTLVRVLDEDPELTVVGTAPDGRKALEIIPCSIPTWCCWTSRCPKWTVCKPSSK